jgi:hypothetical protein
VSEIETFLAQLAETERLAKEAETHHNDWGTCQGLTEVCEPLRLHAYHWDPASVLRWVAAVREILAIHYEIERKVNWDDEDGEARQTYLPVCEFCAPKYSYHETREAALWPCPTVRALMSVYQDQPGREEE